MKTTTSFFPFLMLATIFFGFQNEANAQLDTNDFVTTWDTRNIVYPLTDDRTIYIFADYNYIYNYDIDWNNDGVFDSYGVSSGTSHQYASPGIYTIRIRGVFPSIKFAGYYGNKLISVDQWGNQVWKDLKRAFYGCSNVNFSASDTPILDSIKSLSYFLANTKNFNSNINHWDVSKITNMSNLFNNTKQFNQPLNNWVVDSVVNMSGMFQQTDSFNQTINNWNVSSVLDMSNMFSKATSFNQSLSNWDVSSVLDMSNMFSYSIFNQPLDNWNVSSVSNMSWMFMYSLFNQPINSWDITSVIDMKVMFLYSQFNQNLNNWDFTNTRNMLNMFLGAYKFDQNLGDWNLHSNLNLDRFLNYSNLSKSNYDSTLIGWESISPPLTQNIGVASLSYCNGKTARDSLIARGWNLTGDILNCDTSNMIISWHTDPSGNILIPTDPNYSYNYDVDWDNDGVFDTIGVTTSLSHQYYTSGDYIITIKGTFPSLKFYPRSTNSKHYLIGFHQWGNIELKNLDSAFMNCTKLSFFPIDEPNLDSISSLHSTFKTTGTEFPGFISRISNWDVSTIRNMHSLFSNSIEFNQPLNNWDVSNVTNLSFMFSNATSFNKPLSNWDVSNVTNMSYLFWLAKDFNQIINNWDVSNVTNMSNVFRQAISFDKSLNNWDVSNVVRMDSMFLEANKFNQTLDNWVVSNVTNMSSMFAGTNNFNQPINNWDVSNVTDMTSMFSNTSVFNQPLNNWDMSSVTNIHSMFKSALLFNQPIEVWDISSVTNTGDLFYKAAVFNQPVGAWNMSNVTRMYRMFGEAYAFNQPLNNWDVSNIIDMRYLFHFATSFNQPLNNWDVSNVSYMSNLFNNASSFNQNLATWSINSLSNSLGSFLSSTNMSVENYDSSLIGWQSKPHRRFIYINSYDLEFCKSESARDSLIAGGWSFRGDVLNCDSYAHFVTSWKTSDSSITIPTDPNYTYNYDVDWDNDGVFDSLGITSDITHQYSDTGAYTIRIQGIFPSINFANNQNIVSINQWGDQVWKKLSNAFKNCVNFRSVGKDFPILDSITQLDSMFSFSSFNSDISHWDFSNITSLSGMFENAIYFNQNLGNWDIGSVSDISKMLDNSGLSETNYDSTLIGWQRKSHPSNLTLGAIGLNYCKAKAARDSLIINGWTFLGDSYDCELTHFVTTWKTNNPGSSNDSSVTISTDPNHNYNYAVDWNNDGAFDSTSITGNVTHQYPDTGTYTIRLKGEFPLIAFGTNINNDYLKLVSIDQWGSQAWKSMESAFMGCQNMTYNAFDIPNLDSVSDMSWMFTGCTNINGNISQWDVSNVTDMNGMFEDARNFNQPLNNWSVSNVTNLIGIFKGAVSFNQPLNNWDVSNVTDMDNMFQDAEGFNQNLSSWDVDSVVDMRFMFIGATNFNQNLGNWNIGSIINMSAMLSNSGLSAANYDSTLIGWQSKPHPSNLSLGALGLKYCLAKPARDSLIADGWSFVGDTIDPTCIITSVEKTFKSSANLFKLYPNPTQSQLFIEIDQADQNTPLLIYNQMGQLVKEARLVNGRNQIDLVGQAKGVYFIRYGRISEKIILVD